MTRERLLKMSPEELAALAGSAGIEATDGIGQEELVEMLLENLDELRREREEGNTPSVRVEEAKFGAREEELAPAGGDGPPLPARYNETRVVLMVRDPHWAFAYWDVEDQKAQRVRKDPGFEQLVLRVQDRGPKTFFDIPIQWGDASWYIYLPNPDAEYCLELGYLSSGKFRQLASSEPIHTPRESMLEEQGPPDELFFSTGPTLAGGPSSALSSEAIPQRILSTMRE